MKRAYSPTEIQSMNIPSFPFDGEWEAALGDLTVPAHGSSGEKVEW